MKKRGFELLVFLFVMVFVSIGISASSFTVQNSACDAGKTIMKLSDTTNAHGELASQGNYNTYVCSDEAGSTDCSTELDGDGNPLNKVIGLSGITNAHGEIPSNIIYETDVCFSDLICEVVSGTCSSLEYSGVISLSGTTNAHIGGFSDYGTKICCTSSSESIAYWENGNGDRIDAINPTIPGTTSVKLVFKNTGFNVGDTVDFQIRREVTVFGVGTGIWLDFADSLRDPITSDSIFTDSQGFDVAETFWTIPERIGDPGDTKTLRFEVTHFDGSVITSGEDLVITIPDNAQTYCDNIDICGDYGINDCSNDICDVADDSIPPSEADCSVVDCFCSYFTTPAPATCKAVYLGEDPDDGSGPEKCIITITKEDPDGCADGRIEYEYKNSCDPPGTPDHLNTLTCPAEVQLPFFGFYNFVVTMLVIASIYYFIFSHHNKKRK